MVLIEKIELALKSVLPFYFNTPEFAGKTPEKYAIINIAEKGANYSEGASVTLDPFRFAVHDCGIEKILLTNNAGLPLFYAYFHSCNAKRQGAASSCRRFCLLWKRFRKRLTARCSRKRKKANITSFSTPPSFSRATRSRDIRRMRLRFGTISCSLTRCVISSINRRSALILCG